MTIIPKGYKKTEVGIIPNSWEVLELGTVAPYSKGRLSASLVDEYSYVSCENMIKNKGGVSFPASVPSSGSVVKYNGGDILLGNIRPYLEKIWLANKIGACSTDVLCLQPNIDSVFLYNVLSKDSFFLYVMSNVKGTKMPRGDKKHIAQYKFAAPTNQGEQHAIATTLSDMDALITAKTALLEKKRAIKQGAMQELLTGRRRLPGFAVTPMKQTDIGEIPEDWEVRELATVATYSQDSVTAALAKTQSYVSCENMLKDRGGVVPTMSTPLTGSVIKYKTGDILLGNIRPYLKKIWLADREGTCSTDVLCIQASENSVLLYNILSSDAFFLHVMANVKGTKMPRGDKQHIKQYKFPLPVKKEEQRAIADVLLDMDKEIGALVLEIEKLRNLKRGMMSELLTGRIRLVK